MKTICFFSAVLVAAACGGGDGDDDGDDVADDGDDGDDGDDATPDMRPAANCTAAASYGSPTPAMQAAEHDVANDVYFSSAALNADADLLQLQFYNGIGVFMTGGVVPGTYPITGAESNYRTCGACALMFADTTMAAPPALADANRVYFASAGTITITTVTPNLSGTVTDLQFQHVTIDTAGDFTSTPVGDCSSTLTSLAFDATVVDGKPSRPGEPITINLRPLSAN